MLARDIMSTPLVTVTPADSLEKAATRMIDRKISCLPVVDGSGALVGVLTESDFQAKEAHAPFSLYAMPQLFGRWIDVDGMQQIYAEARSTPVSSVMSPEPVTLDGEASVEKVASVMLERHVHHVVIVDGGKPLGVVARRDLMRALLTKK